MTDLSDLISRVRAATGPDRRLDAEISCAFYFPDLRPAEPDDFSGAYGYTPGNIKVKHGFLMAESFTSSLDDAVALCERVLPGSDWQLCRGGDCTLIYGARFMEPLVAEASAPTPALALCLAILTAKEKANDRA